MNNAIITLSFDDARKDTYHVFRDILAPLDLKADMLNVVLMIRLILDIMD